MFYADTVNSEKHVKQIPHVDQESSLSDVAPVSYCHSYLSRKGQ